jgi:prepilin-type N-terminal cleavage/methylation domain-containing protein
MHHATRGRVRLVNTQAGFSLAEVVVAMTLLSIGTLAVAATGLVAAEAFTRAELQERVLRDAEAILDSLIASPQSTAGARNVHGALLVWTAGDSTGALTMRVKLPARAPFEIAAQR